MAIPKKVLKFRRIRAKNYIHARKVAKKRGYAVRSIKYSKKQPKKTKKGYKTFIVRKKINKKTIGTTKTQKRLKKKDKWTGAKTHPHQIKGEKGRYYQKSGTYHKQNYTRDKKILAKHTRPKKYPSWTGDIKGKKI